MGQQLKIESWMQWEELCCYLLSYKVYRMLGLKGVYFQTYGTRGESQHGIDLVPERSLLPIVGQSKMRDGRSFTWEHLEAELQKTNKYPNSIEHYVLFTTASRHTSIQNALNSDRRYYWRPNGSRFEIHVEYWEDYEDLRKVVPPDALHKIFPTISRHAASLPSIDPAIGHKAYIESLEALRAFILSKFPIDILHWLETWDWSTGCVPSTHYDQLFDLYIEVSHVQTLAKNRYSSGLTLGSRPNIYRSLEAGSALYEALANFCVLIRGHTISGQLEDGSPALCLSRGIANHPPGETHRWADAARHLAETYRRDVLGEAVN